MNFSDWKIGLRLGAGITAILLLTLIIGGAGAWSIYAISKANGDLRLRTHRMLLMKEWEGMLDSHAEMTSAYFRINDDPEQSRIQKKANEQTQRINAIMKEFADGAAADGDTPEADQSRAMLAAIDKATLEFRNARFAAMRLQAQGDPADAPRIAALVHDRLLPTMQAYIKLVSDYRAQLEKQADEAQARAVRATVVGYSLLAVFTVAVLLLGAWLGWRLTRGITAPLSQAVRVAHAVAAGDLTLDVSGRTRADETGELLKALSQMNERLRVVVTEVRQGVESVTSASNEIANGNADLSARTEQTAANLEETAASIEELTSTVVQSADTAGQANQLASTAAQSAANGGKVVQQVVASMAEITESSRKIADIINVIDGIAFQTNILALNAAVEAARAGEQGRGFAVVAGEVRALAQRSADAAKEIKELITASAQNVDAGSAQVAQAGRSMEEIVASVQRVTDLIGEIATATNEQRDGISQINQAINNLDQMTQQNAALVEESTAAAQSMRDQSHRLAEVVSVFNVGEGSAPPRLALPA